MNFCLFELQILFQWHKDLFMCAHIPRCLFTPLCDRCGFSLLIICNSGDHMLHCLPICACVIVLVCISFLSVPGYLYMCFYFRTCATVFVCTTEPHRLTDVTVARTYVKACQATFSMNSQFISSFGEKYCCYS